MIVSSELTMCMSAASIRFCEPTYWFDKHYRPARIHLLVWRKTELAIRLLDTDYHFRPGTVLLA